MSTTTGRPLLYREPTRPVNFNLPKSIVDWLDELADASEHGSRSRVAAEMLDYLRLQMIKQELAFRPA